MSTCYDPYDVVLQLTGDDSGKVARIDPGDFRDSDSFQYDRKVGGGGAFDTEQLPALLAAARRHFARPVTAVWVCREETEDIPADESKLPWLVPADYDPGPLDFGRTMIVLENKRATEEIRQKLDAVWTEFLAEWDDQPHEHFPAQPLNHSDDLDS